MGLFQKLFRKEETKSYAVYAPACGTEKTLKELGDGVFSEGILGPGCIIEPKDGRIVAPVAGIITLAAETGHAIGITSDDGLEILIHVGIDTVEMKGEGFDVRVTAGQKVQPGDLLLNFDREAVHKAGYIDTVVVLITNGNEVGEVELTVQGEIAEKDSLLKVTAK